MMLMKGDLVRVPQNTRVQPLGVDSWRLSLTTKPQYGIVIEVKTSTSVVLLGNHAWTVDNKDIQLYGGEHVHKTA